MPKHMQTKYRSTSPRKPISISIWAFQNLETSTHNLFPHFYLPLAGPVLAGPVGGSSRSPSFPASTLPCFPAPLLPALPLPLLVRLYARHSPLLSFHEQDLHPGNILIDWDGNMETTPHIVCLDAVRKTPPFEPFAHKNGHFTKTGSGQT